MNCLISADESAVAIDCRRLDDCLIAGLLGIQELVQPPVELIDKETGDRYTVALPPELVNQPIYLVGENIPLTIISRTNS
jgi:hypothetical protein